MGLDLLGQLFRVEYQLRRVELINQLAALEVADDALDQSWLVGILVVQNALDGLENFLIDAIGDFGNKSALGQGQEAGCRHESN